MSPECMLTVEELDRMDDLSGSTLLSAEEKRMEFLSPEEQAVYIEAARGGDELAGQRLLLNCLNWTMTKAVSIYRDREPAHSDLMDLVGHAHLKMLEALPKALHANDPMRYLAENPLGTRTTMSNTEVGKMLNALPPRAAFVRSGETVGVIYTHDTPPKLSDREYTDRVTGIRDHTRHIYCRPRAEVEQALLGTQAVPPPAPPAAPSMPAAPMPPPPAATPAPPSQPAGQPKLSGWEEAE